jgi:hypothetical protein
MAFVSKQCTWHGCSNNTNKWMTFVFIPYKLWKTDFAWLLFFKSWPMKFVMQGQLVFKNLHLLLNCCYHVHNHFHLHTQNTILQHFCFIIFLPNFVVLHAYWKLHPTIIQGFHNFTFLKYLHPIIHLLFIAFYISWEGPNSLRNTKILSQCHHFYIPLHNPIWPCKDIKYILNWWTLKL